MNDKIKIIMVLNVFLTISAMDIPRPATPMPNSPLASSRSSSPNPLSPSVKVSSLMKIYNEERKKQAEKQKADQNKELKDQPINLH